MKNIKVELLQLTLFEGNVIKSDVSGDLFFDFLTFNGSNNFTGVLTKSRYISAVENIPGNPLIQVNGKIYTINVTSKEDSLSESVFDVSGTYSNLYTQIYNNTLNVNVLASKPFVNPMTFKRSYENKYEGVSLIKRQGVMNVAGGLYGLPLSTYVQTNGRWVSLGDESIGMLNASGLMPKWQGMLHVNEKGEATDTDIGVVTGLGIGPLNLKGSFEDMHFDFNSISIDNDSFNEVNSGKYELQNVILAYPSINESFKWDVSQAVGPANFDSNFYGGGSISFSLQTPAGSLGWSRDWEFVYRMRDNYQMQFVTSGTPDARILHVIDNGEEVASAPLGSITQSMLEGPGSRAIYGESAAQLTQNARMINELGQQKPDFSGGAESVVGYIGTVVNSFFSVFGLFADYFNKSKVINKTLGSMYQPAGVTASGSSNIKSGFVKIDSYIGNTLLNSAVWYGQVLADVYGGSELNPSPNGYNPVMGTDTKHFTKQITITNGLKDVYDEYNDVTFYGANKIYLDELGSNIPNY